MFFELPNAVTGIETYKEIKGIPLDIASNILVTVLNQNTA